MAKIFTNTELLQLVKADREANLTALNGLLDVVPSPLKEQIQKLKDDLNAKLKSICGMATTLKEAGVAEDKLEAIAKQKMPDLNAASVETAMKSITECHHDLTT